MLPFGPTTPAGACTVFGKEKRKERFSDEGEKRVREKTRRRKSIGGRWKEKRGGRKTGGGSGGRRKATRWKGGGSRRVEDGRVAASKGCQGGGIGAGGEGEWLRREGAGARAYGAGKLTPFLAYPRSLFNCILLSNFPRRAIDRDTRKGVRLRLISDGPRRLLSALYPRLFPPTFSLRFSLGRPPAPARPCPLSLSLSSSLSYFLTAASTSFVLDYLIHLTHINPILRESESVREHPVLRPGAHPSADYLKLHIADA